LGLDAAALIVRQIADLHEGVDKEAQALWVGSRPAEMCGA
jgi:hypothetical protein